MKISQLSVFLENRPHSLLEPLQALVFGQKADRAQVLVIRGGAGSGQRLAQRCRVSLVYA